MMQILVKSQKELADSQKTRSEHGDANFFSSLMRARNDTNHSGHLSMHQIYKLEQERSDDRSKSMATDSDQSQNLNVIETLNSEAASMSLDVSQQKLNKITEKLSEQDSATGE